MYQNINGLNYLEVSADALEQNVRMIREFIKVPIIAMLKCDGYGVSVCKAAQVWQKVGVTMFGVSKPQEALSLRQAGFQEDILLVSPVSDADLCRMLMEHQVILTITGVQMAKWMGSLKKEGIPLRVHVAVDTGLGRFGVKWTDIAQLKEIYGLEGFSFEGIFSHFSSSFEKYYCNTRLQLERFLKVTRELTEAGIAIGIRHIANSCAALRFPDTHLDAVRIGSALIGRLPAEVPLPLQPVGVFKAQVVDDKQFLKGDVTGYASVCRIRQPTRAVVVAIGRENGFGYLKTPDKTRLRDFGAYLYHMLQGYFHKPYVTHKEEQLKLVGRIGTQYTLFDATGLEIEPGEYVSAQVDMLFPHERRRVI